MDGLGDIQTYKVQLEQVIAQVSVQHEFPMKFDFRLWEARMGCMAGRLRNPITIEFCPDPLYFDKIKC